MTGVPATKPAPRAVKPRFHRDQAAYDAEQKLNTQQRLGRTTTSLGPAPPSSSQTPRIANLQGNALPLDSLAMQRAEPYGADQDLNPPDTQLAVGPSHLVEATNSTLSIWTKTGTLVSATDLNAFFALSAPMVFSDPRILYDAESQRFFLSGLGFNPNTADSTVFIAASTSSDPTQPWHVHGVRSQTGVVQDQPETGVDYDKVVVSWNNFAGAVTPTFTGAETWILEKTDVLGIGSVASVQIAQDPNRYRIVPSISLSPSTTEWLTYNNADCALACTVPGKATIGVIAVTGLPSTMDVHLAETDPAIQGTSPPPPPRQPGTGAPTVDPLIDDVFLTSVWDNGTLWVSGNDACVPNGDSAVRSCMRVISLSTTGAAPTVNVDGDIGSNTLDTYYPAVSLNNLGDLFVGFSFSSSALFPSAGALYVPVGTTTFSPTVQLAAGQTSYSFGGHNRWGDYSGAAQDPTNPSDVWVAQEYQASSSDSTDWGTVAGHLVIPPSITYVTPSLGLIAGGQTVTVNGDHFQTGSTVTFGTGAGTNVNVLSSHQIQVTTPAAASAGLVDVTVTETDGSSATASRAYAYSTALGTAYTAVTPARYLDTRISHTTLGPVGTLNLTVTGGAASVPTDAQSVVLNVTVTDTTAPSFLTIYPTGSPLPQASNLNWVAGKTVPNLVSVPVGVGGQISIYNLAGSVDVIVDVEGYFAPVSGTAGEFQPLAPYRILDTRTGNGAPVGKLGPNSTMQLQVTGRGGVPVPPGVSAVVLNVTVTGPTANSFLTIWPGTGTPPTASNLNFTAGETVANRVIVPVSTGGSVSIYNLAGSTDVVADVNGYLTDASASGGQLFFPVSPTRVKDTRLTGQTLGVQGTVAVAVAAANGIPANATAAVLNVTTTDTTAPSYFTVYPSGTTLPVASDLNWLAGWTVPNLVVVKLGAGGATVYNRFGSADAVVDVFGYFVPAPGIAVTAQPSSISAGASNHSTITAMVTLPDGSAPAGDSVTFATAGPACGTVTSPGTTDATGTATATYTAAASAGQCTINVNDAARGLSGSVTITQT